MESTLQLGDVEEHVRRAGRILLLAMDVAPVLAVGVVELAPSLLRWAQAGHPGIAGSRCGRTSSGSGARPERCDLVSF